MVGLVALVVDADVVLLVVFLVADTVSPVLSSTREEVCNVPVV